MDALFSLAMVMYLVLPILYLLSPSFRSRFFSSWKFISHRHQSTHTSWDAVIPNHLLGKLRLLLLSAQSLTHTVYSLTTLSFFSFLFLQRATRSTLLEVKVRTRTGRLIATRNNDRETYSSLVLTTSIN